MEGREIFLIELNKAFASCDVNLLANSVTNDFQWIIVGEKTISGKKDFEKSLVKMSKGGPMSINVLEIITQKEKSVVEGEVELMLEPGKKRKYSFCDVYIFSDADKNKVKELRTYVTQMKKV